MGLLLREVGTGPVHAGQHGTHLLGMSGPGRETVAARQACDHGSRFA